MKEGLFILALLIVSSYAIDIRHPGAASHPEHKTLKPAATPIPKQSPAAHPQAQFRAAKIQSRNKAKVTTTTHAAATHAVATHAATHQEAGNAVQLDVHQLNTTNVTAPVHVKRTPGAACNVYTTCVECTDDESKAFYCMWSAARNVCQEDTDMDKLKRANPEDLWTKQCAPKEPLPIVDCNGCPINNPLDKKPERDIVDAKNKGSDGHEVSAVEGSLKLLGTDPNDPVTGPITHPNGTNGPQYLLPSIRDEDGNIKDPVQDPEKLTYSPCVGDANCAAASSRFVSSTRKGKFAPDLLTDDSSDANAQTDEPRMQQNRHVPHVDKVEMQEAAMEDEPKDDDDTNAKTTATDSSELEVSSRVVKDADAATPAPGGGFTPTFSDDDTSSSTDAAAPAASSSTDEPRFKQTTNSKHSEFKGMSAGKAATQSKESTMEVTEFDDNVVGGKKINEDDDAKPTKEEADSKQ